MIPFEPMAVPPFTVRLDLDLPAADRGTPVRVTAVCPPGAELNRWEIGIPEGGAVRTILLRREEDLARMAEMPAESAELLARAMWAVARFEMSRRNHSLGYAIIERIPGLFTDPSRRACWHLHGGLVMELAGRKSRAGRQYSMALALEPDEPVLWQNTLHGLARICHATGREADKQHYIKLLGNPGIRMDLGN